MTEIAEFSGAFRFLSNFWPCKVVLDGEEYQSVEHAYQAAKTIKPEEREFIRESDTAGKAKRMGRHVTMREDWESVKVKTMLNLLRQKFRDGPLMDKLVATGDAKLTEGNKWGDVFWGVCNGHGQNVLGKLLMQVRAELMIEV
jgi:ribA/ribD-fused uncharacterized protein